MEKITHIFLDMDGIIADFFTAALRRFNAEHLAKNWPDGEWHMEKPLGITASEFWERIDNTPSFWESLPRLKHADEWVGFCKSSGVPWAILTSPCCTGWEACVTGKRKWLKSHYASIANRMIAFNDKAMLSGPGRLLIDDSDSNCEAWIAAGGKAAMPDRPWNKSTWGDAELIAMLRAGQ